MAWPVLAIDIDEVLFPFTPEFLKLHNRQHNLNIEPSDLETYYFIEELTGSDKLEDVVKVIDGFMEHAYTNKIGPYNDTVAAIKQLKSSYELHVVTARRPTTLSITELWLKDHFPEVFQSIQFSIKADGGQIIKAEVCRAIGASILIDDHIDNAKGCAELGIKFLLFGDFNWQKDWQLPAGAVRVKNWDEVLKELL